MPLTELVSELVYCVTVPFTNLLRLNGDFSFGKSQKSQRAKSGLQRCRQTRVMQCFAKKASMTAVEWVGALSWWNCQSSLVHNCGHFLLNASLSQQRTSMDYYLVIASGIPSASSNSRTVNHWFSLIAAHTRSTFLGVLLVEGLPECGSLSTDSQPSLKRRYQNFIWASLNDSSPKAFLIIWIVSMDKKPSLN